MIDNIWFYTLSTSAQVLASLSGLFAVFVIWKIQYFEEYISEVRNAILRMMPYLSNTIIDYHMKDMDELYFMTDLELLDVFSEILKIKEKQPERVTYSPNITSSQSQISYFLDDRTKYLYERNIKKKIAILRSLKNILIINFTVMSACIMYLTFSSSIENKYITLIVITILVIYCLYSISRGIYKITIK